MEVIFTFHNTHGAINGEKRLLEGGLKVKVMALPSSLGAGCGLCLRVDVDDLEKSRQILSASGTAPEAAYYKTTKNGRIHYVPAI